MKGPKEQSSRLSAAVEATGILWRQRFGEFIQEGQSEAHIANAEIGHLPISQKNGRFYGRFLPLLEELTTLFADTYRRYFKLALANPLECGPNAHEWACNQLQGGMTPVGEWILDWYALACDGENRYVQRATSIPFAPGETITASISTSRSLSFDSKSWRAPIWLFTVSPLMGFGPLKSENVPNTDSEHKLGPAHTRLLLKGMRKVFLWKLGAEIDTTRNEETAAAGAVAASSGQNEPITRKRREPKPQPKGFEGLREKKYDYSEYTHTMTEKQHMAFSLRLEYGLPLGKVASRMGVDRKTAYEHISAANVKVNQLHSAGKRKSNRAKRTLDD